MIIESVGMDRTFMKLVAKILPSMEYHICTGYRVSRESYSSAKKDYTGIGQGNQFSREIYKIKSGVII